MINVNDGLASDESDDANSEGVDEIEDTVINSSITMDTNDNDIDVHLDPSAFTRLE